MISKTIIFISSIVFCSASIACDYVENETTAITSTISENADNSVSISNQQIDAGMSAQAINTLLGEPKIVQTRTLDTLIITHREWTNDMGTTSVQFLNGKVQYHQFTPLTK